MHFTILHAALYAILYIVHHTYFICMCAVYMYSQRKMSGKQVSDLAAHAKELSSRFDRGSFQKSF